MRKAIAMSDILFSRMKILLTLDSTSSERNSAGPRTRSALLQEIIFSSTMSFPEPGTSTQMTRKGRHTNIRSTAVRDL